VLQHPKRVTDTKSHYAGFLAAIGLMTARKAAAAGTMLTVRVLTNSFAICIDVKS
jgi:hypothetical protein